MQRLDNSHFDDWMRGTPDQAADLMKPYAGEIEAWEVGAEVGNMKNNRPELIERVASFSSRRPAPCPQCHNVRTRMAAGAQEPPRSRLVLVSPERKRDRSGPA